MMKIKTLILKFSYGQLLKLCQEKGWEIPSVEQLRQSADDEVTYEWVWVRDEPTHDNDDGTRKVLYSKSLDKTIQVNQNFIENCVVIKKKGK